MKKDAEKVFRKTLPAAPENDWNFSGENAFDYLYDLSEVIGSRLGGTKGEREAAEYISKKFRSFGMRTFLHKFPIWGEITKKVIVDGVKVSAAAAEKIKAAGGEIK